MLKQQGLIRLLSRYWQLILLLLLLVLISNGLSLWLPKLIGDSIDSFAGNVVHLRAIVTQFSGVALAILLLGFVQHFVQVYAAERVARDLRATLADRLSGQDYCYVDEMGTAGLLTNFTADVEAVKLFAGQFMTAAAASVITSVGAAAMLFIMHWQLAIWVIGVIPLAAFALLLVQSRTKAMYAQSRPLLDHLNKIIEETILGAMLIRIVNGQAQEQAKFRDASLGAKKFGFAILRPYTWVIPLIPFTANAAALIVLALGGHYVITGAMSLGELMAFNGYISMVLFPVIMLCTMSNGIAEATIAYQRIQAVGASDTAEAGGPVLDFQSEIVLAGVSKNYGQTLVLKDVSFTLRPGDRVAVVGPTAAGKTQLLYLLAGLTRPGSGSVKFDGYDAKQSRLRNGLIGFVFQDSILFNMSIRANISFSEAVSEAALEKAIETAALKEFIAALPDGLDTVVAERGASLSGGQKQRLMLARALAANPKLLLLDDFTARVDTRTGQQILGNLKKNYPALTLVVVSQKIDLAEAYDQVLLLMQGEMVAAGKHEDLLLTSPDYLQMLNSQQSTQNYEVPT